MPKRTPNIGTRIREGKLTVVGAVHDFRNDRKHGAGKLDNVNVNANAEPKRMQAFVALGADRAAETLALVATPVYSSPRMGEEKSIFAPGLFSGQVAIVTGGGTGIGLAIAKELGSLGAKVAIGSRKRENVDAGLAELDKHGIQAMGGELDVREAETCERFVKEVLQRFGKVDILVNNAGGQFPSPAQNISARGFEAVIRNNLNGLFFMTLATANLAMIPARRGRIVNVIADIARGFPGMVHTGAARAGVDNMTKTLAVEWATFGIRVNACAPGTIRSSGTLQYGEGTLEGSRKATPLKRLGTVEEVSRVVVFLASDANDFVTGSTYYVDGGGSLWGDVWPIEEPKNPA